jgi:hypothetical protein
MWTHTLEASWLKLQLKAKVSKKNKPVKTYIKKLSFYNMAQELVNNRLNLDYRPT